MFLKIVNVASIIIPVITRPTTDITITSGTGIFNIIKFIQLLLDHGADINITTNGNWTALTYACFSQNTDVVKLLLNKGANGNLKDRDNKTILMYAYEEGFFDIIDIFLQYGITC